MNVAITAATEAEWLPIQHRVKELEQKIGTKHNIQFYTTGVGLLSATFSLTKILLQTPPDLVIQTGIAGSFNTTLPLTTVVVVEHEYLGDTGVLEEGVFRDVFDLGLAQSDAAPFNQKALPNPWLHAIKPNYALVKSVTVNEISTDPARIAALTGKYQCSVESMEGAALHFAALQTGVPFVQIRAISNYIGERDKAQWQIKQSITNAADAVLQLIENLQQHSFATNRPGTPLP